MNDAPACSCNDTAQTKDETCFVCNTVFHDMPMNEYERRIRCARHETIYPCGYGPPYSCEACVSAGWETRGGDGGGMRAVNANTGEYRDHAYWRKMNKKTNKD